MLRAERPGHRIARTLHLINSCADSVGLGVDGQEADIAHPQNYRHIELKLPC